MVRAMGQFWRGDISRTLDLPSLIPKTVTEILLWIWEMMFAALPVSPPLQDVMVVGEPTLMGGEFGDEDERLITRLENTQFDAANGVDDEDSFNGSPALGANSPWNGKAPSSQESKNDNPTSQSSQ